MRFGVLSIGNEVVKGRTVNTNASEISRSLIDSGHEVIYVVTCRDDEGEICKSINFLMHDCDAIITSGGLGPTPDDLTLRALSSCLSLPLKVDAESLEMLRGKYKEFNLELTEERKKMAMMPEGAEPMENKVGTAPGMFLRHAGKLIFSTPGVPREMRGMLDSIVELAGRGNLNYISNEVRISGIMESTFAPYVMEIMDRFEGRIFVKSHPESIELRDPILTIEVYGYSTNKEELSRDIEEAINSVKEISRKLGGKISQ